jgi:hypothetical protein
MAICSESWWWQRPVCDMHTYRHTYIHTYIHTCTHTDGVEEEIREEIAAFEIGEGEDVGSDEEVEVGRSCFYTEDMLGQREVNRGSDKAKERDV